MPRFRLSSYLLLETAGLFALGVAAFILLLSIDRLASWASYLIDYNATPGVVGRLMLISLPEFLHLSLPIAVVFAALLATGRLAKDSELKAAYSLGVPPLSLLWPLLLFGLLVSGFALFNNGYLEPLGKIATDDLVATFLTQRPPTESQSDVSYVLSEGVYFAGRIRTQEGDRGLADLSGVTIIESDGTVINASSGLWDSRERTWTLSNAERTPPDGAPTVVGTVTLPFNTGGDAGTTLARSATLTLSELWARYEAAHAAGSETRALLFDFHRRLADAGSAFVFVIIAGALGLTLRNRAAGFGWTIVLLALFYSLWTLSESLFSQNVLPPLSAAWFTSAAVGLLGVVLAVVRLR